MRWLVGQIGRLNGIVLEIVKLFSRVPADSIDALQLCQINSGSIVKGRQEFVGNNLGFANFARGDAWPFHDDGNPKSG